MSVALSLFTAKNNAIRNTRCCSIMIFDIIFVCMWSQDHSNILIIQFLFAQIFANRKPLFSCVEKTNNGGKLFVVGFTTKRCSSFLGMFDLEIFWLQFTKWLNITLHVNFFLFCVKSIKMSSSFYGCKVFFIWMW